MVLTLLTGYVGKTGKNSAWQRFRCACLSVSWHTSQLTSLRCFAETENNCDCSISVRVDFRPHCSWPTILSLNRTSQKYCCTADICHTQTFAMLLTTYRQSSLLFIAKTRLHSFQWSRLHRLCKFRAAKIYGMDKMAAAFITHNAIHFMHK
jgi:hypothetical protein